MSSKSILEDKRDILKSLYKIDEFNLLNDILRVLDKDGVNDNNTKTIVLNKIMISIEKIILNGDKNKLHITITSIFVLWNSYLKTYTAFVNSQEKQSDKLSSIKLEMANSRQKKLKYLSLLTDICKLLL